jgi:hypothetical protein
MEIKIELEELRKRKIFVGVPMYGGQCYGSFTKSSNDLVALATHHGVDVRFYYLFNESLIPRARNYIANEFLRSDCTHLLFIDSDIGFDANDVIGMAALMSDESEYDVLCAPYCKKTIAFEKIKAAVDMGFADDDPNELEKFVGDYVFNPVGGKETIRLDIPEEVMESGTGFMMIKRKTFEKLDEAYPQFMYRPDHVRTAAFDGSREIMAYFDAVIDNKHLYIKDELREFYRLNPEATPEQVLQFISDTKTSVFGYQYSNRYLSEDYLFCQLVRRIGMKVFLAPWIKLTHTGSYIFSGSLADLAKAQVSPTADPSKLKNKK